MKIEILHFDKFKFDHEEQLHDIYIKRISQFRNIITDKKTVKINNKGIENRIVKKKAFFLTILFSIPLLLIFTVFLSVIIFLNCEIRFI